MLLAGTAPAPARSVGQQTDVSGGTAPLSADEFFERARDVWTAQHYPDRLSYRVKVRVFESGAILENHYQGSYSARAGDIRVFAFSSEETAHPFTPHGIDVFVAVSVTKGSTATISRQVSRNPPVTDYLGVPMIHPAYSFGLARLRRSKPAAQTLDQQTATTLPTIGHVSTRQRDYAVSLIGMEVYDGARAAHLALRPLRDPRRYRLRQMWIDPSSFATRKIVTDGNFFEGPPVSVEWTTTFKQVDSVQYIDTESTDAPLDYGIGRHYSSATISFEAIEQDVGRNSSLLLTNLPRRPDELREPDP